MTCCAGHIETVDRINEGPEEAQEAVITHLESLAGGDLSPEMAASDFEGVEFTVDPIAASLRGGADHAEALGLPAPVGPGGIYELDPLNALLAEDGREEVAGL